MNLKNAFITAIRALGRNKMRSSLTSIGIIIGVSSVIVMIGLGSSAQIAVKEKIYSYGLNAMSVYSWNKPITRTDIETLKKSFFQIKYITPVCYTKKKAVKFRNRHMKVRLYGVNNDFFSIKDRKIDKGRLFTENEAHSTAKVAVIGKSTKKELFPNINPIGQQILLENTPLKVIGILEELGLGFSGVDFDNIVAVPYSTANTRIWNRSGFSHIYVSTHNEKMIEETKNILERFFRRRHSIPDGKENDFKIGTSKDKLKMADDISQALSILLAGIASISLFVGGVGIMNIMLVSVTERTREIGIRMAIGAKRRDIMTQFLIESVTLSTVGGVIGIIMGLVIYNVIIYFIEWPFIFSISAILISVLFAAAVGIFFGYYPSRKASNLKPIDALKFE